MPIDLSTGVSAYLPEGVALFIGDAAMRPRRRDRSARLGKHQGRVRPLSPAKRGTSDIAAPAVTSTLMSLSQLPIIQTMLSGTR
jgi:hypothetical protein